MNNFYNIEIAMNKIKEFVETSQKEFLSLIAQLDRLGKSIMKGFFNEDEHNGLQLFTVAVSKIENGDRNWDFEEVKLEAMIYNTAKSHLSSELRKILRRKNKLESNNNPAEENNQINEEHYSTEGAATNEKYKRDNEGSYEIQQIDDDTISEMIKKELPLIDGDIDLESIEIMEVIKGGEATKQKDIAEILKITEKEVRNSIDRIKRAASKVFNKLPKLDKEEIENYKTDYKIKNIIKHKLQENIQK